MIYRLGGYIEWRSKIEEVNNNCLIMASCYVCMCTKHSCINDLPAFCLLNSVGFPIFCFGSCR